MVISSWRLFTRYAPLLAVSALLVAGCDRQSASDAQGGPSEETPARPAAHKGEGDSGALAERLDRLQAGRALPQLTLADSEGQKLDLASLKGKPALINLWATWCAPCVKELPMLDDLAERYEGRLRVVTISEDLQGAKVVTPFWAARDFAMLRPWLDPDNAASGAFEGGQLPLTIYFGADGKEQWRVEGAYDWASEEAEVLIEESLREEGLAE